MERLTGYKINGWTFEETIETTESLMEVEKNMFKWDVLRHLRDFAESYREKLAEYEDLEEQGRLLKLPCKIGDTVWQIMLIGVEAEHMKPIYDVFRAVVIGLHIDSMMNLTFLTVTQDKQRYRDGITLRTTGDMVFLTKSEAEAKLKELRGEEE